MPDQPRDEDGENTTSPSSTTDIMAESKEQSVETMDPDVSTEEAQEYLTGIKLLMTMFSLTFVGFLMLLDVSIVATVSLALFFVSYLPFGISIAHSRFCRPFQESLPISIP